MINLEADKQKVMEVAVREAAAMQSGDMNQYSAILCTDAVFMPPNLTAIEGDELRRWLREFIDHSAVEWPRFEHGATVVAGELAFHEYLYTMRVTPKAGGHAATGYGKGMQILRREADGSWKILRNIWNARPADPAA